MGLAPLYQYTNEIATTPGYAGMTDQSYFTVNLLTLVFMLIMEITYKRHRICNQTKIFLKSHTMHITKFGYLSMLLISCWVFFIFLNRVEFDYVRIFLRQSNADLIVDDPFTNMYNNLLTPILGVFTLYILIFGNNNKVKIITLSLLLFFVFPLRVARYMTAMIYMPVCFYFIHPILKKSKNLFQIFFVVIICLIFPLMDMFRTADFSVLASSFADFNYLSFDFLKSTQFDSYQSFVFVLENEVITYGRQLSGVLFFWVPRFIWQNKPIGSGMFIADEFELCDYGFNNLALNFLGEGYINFGITGCLLFMVVYAIVSCRLDHRFWDLQKGKINDIFTAYYFCAIANVFFMLRGSLLAAFPMLIGTSFAIYFTQKFLIKRKNNNA